MGCEADVTANELIQYLLAGKDFTVPDVDLNADIFQFPESSGAAMYSAINRLHISDLTEGAVAGEGAFDVLMTSVRAHLLQEYEKGRITGAEYTKAYSELTAAVMEQATEFVLNKDQVYWTAQQAQIQAITARIQMESEKVRLAALKFEALTAEVNYALTKLKLATENTNYCIAEYNLKSVLPAQLALTTAQTQGQNTANQKATYELNTILPKQAAMMDSQKLGQDVANQTAEYNYSHVQPQQYQLLREQTETQRAQTMENRTDGSLVKGYVGKQKDLYTQQIESYKRDAEIKAAKLVADGWMTQKTIDEAALTPNAFQQHMVDAVLTTVKTKNGL